MEVRNERVECDIANHPREENPAPMWPDSLSFNALSIKEKQAESSRNAPYDEDIWLEISRDKERLQWVQGYQEETQFSERDDPKHKGDCHVGLLQRDKEHKDRELDEGKRISRIAGYSTESRLTYSGDGDANIWSPSYQSAYSGKQTISDDHEVDV